MPFLDIHGRIIGLRHMDLGKNYVSAHSHRLILTILIGPLIPDRHYLILPQAGAKKLGEIGQRNGPSTNHIHSFPQAFFQRKHLHWLLCSLVVSNARWHFVFPVSYIMPIVLPWHLLLYDWDGESVDGEDVASRWHSKEIANAADWARRAPHRNIGVSNRLLIK